jgi:hypothetical protein
VTDFLLCFNSADGLDKKGELDVLSLLAGTPLPECQSYRMLMQPHLHLVLPSQSCLLVAILH